MVVERTTADCVCCFSIRLCLSLYLLRLLATSSPFTNALDATTMKTVRIARDLHLASTTSFAFAFAHIHNVR